MYLRSLDEVLEKAKEIAQRKKWDRIMKIDIRITPRGEWKGEYVIEPAPNVPVDESSLIESCFREKKEKKLDNVG